VPKDGRPRITSGASSAGRPYEGLKDLNRAEAEWSLRSPAKQSQRTERDGATILRE